MKLEIFNVEHGQCALLTGDDGEHLLIDAGHNSTTGWRPSNYLPEIGVNYLEHLIISNADEDHASDLYRLRQAVFIENLYHNPTVNAADIYTIKGIDQCGDGILALGAMLSGFTEPVRNPPRFGGLKLEMFWNDYPKHFKDENNLSLVSILRWPNLAICFPGDMQKQGWLRLCQDPAFRQAMSGVHLLVASHHGRDDGRSEALFNVTGLNPQVVVISDGGKQHTTQETVDWYATRTRGIKLYGRDRYVLTTRTDGNITVEISPMGGVVYTSRGG